MRNRKANTVANILDRVFLEHGSPAALLTDHDRTILSSEAVKLVLARHGTKHYRLYTYYKTIFLSVITREATNAGDYDTLVELKSLGEVLSTAYYKHEFFIQLLAADTTEDLVRIEALRICELECYYGSSGEVDTSMTN
ncbi:hypothetical protein Pmar_PMAR014502 [Perkinsus marinus ATCC 50983]|uniref:Uncharacterized protein n=1 Tax=Perkinsus marinus (strain ATCC 50983 / TXsc) TaxID=423536 RepID=C5KW93_PERM5|nr:hypothetical protein Pmar_PMAR014502 [Perkinsus marinus ATCC 50983]EER11204.1 hypothetical protein Pmar_PMAR014502 [Perkinsus marinus ATCC 50983]|eukprot:XP_002779409.1 hypothetical protein Pmar_PMAR014502 [Perkinsus marinus ATCC 50983]